jgi:hypothetical protein
MSDEISLAPVAAWELQSIPHMGAVALTLQYLVSPMETPEQSHGSPNFLFHTALLRELAQAMIRAADKAESDGMSSPPGPRN